jgi:hypothetical protein
MKKIILCALVLCAFTLANAQSREIGTFELTPFLGSSSSNYNFDGKTSSANSPINSVTYGIDGDYYFNNRWSIRSGLLIQTMGSEYNRITEKLNYLTIPINANWHFGSTRKWNLNFGPSIGFLMSAKANDTDINNLVNPTQYGLNFGIGYRIEIQKNIGILIDYQGMSGSSDISKASGNLTNVYSTFDVGCVFKL